MSSKPSRDSTDVATWAGVRTILVPPDIVAVKRTSPPRTKKQTPLRPRPEGVTTERGGGRDWFSDRLFVEARQENIHTACGTSITAHASAVILVIVGLLTQSEAPPVVRAGQRLVMPAMVAAIPMLNVAAPTTAAIVPSPPAAERRPDTPPPPPPPLFSAEAAPAPLEAPSSLEPETGAEFGANGDSLGSEAGTPGGVEGGVPGGVVGGTIGGSLPAGQSVALPLRVGGGIEPPRKIKDVRPTYPQNALSDQARGTVLIEAIVGTDGKVQDARILQSVPLLDQAALDAVRQWEFIASRLNGVPVAVIITVIVQFAIH